MPLLILVLGKGGLRLPRSSAVVHFPKETSVSFTSLGVSDVYEVASCVKLVLLCRQKPGIRIKNPSFIGRATAELRVSIDKLQWGDRILSMTDCGRTWYLRSRVAK